MFVEHMDGGTLTDFIDTFILLLDEQTISFIISEILNGLLTIHQNKCIHRDIKSDNILISKDGKVLHNHYI